MKIVVENTVCLNTGDAAILLAIRHILKAVVGDAPHFFVFDSQPEVAVRLYPKKDYPDLEFHKLLSESMFRYSYGRGLKHLLKPYYNRLVLQVLRRFGADSAVGRALFGKSDRRSLGIYRNADLV